MEKEYTELSELLNDMKIAVEGNFCDRLWVRAEIRSLNHKPNGHCYLELMQSQNRMVVASVRGTIWASRFNYIDQYFKACTGASMEAGMEILALVRVSFHPVYGLSLNIEEVDPLFTLGAGERLRQETIERLEKEGLMTRQKSLSLPLLPYSLAVISARGAAGFGDFHRHLAENAYGFVFHVMLFEATMQGDTAPDSIMSAFSEILASDIRYDAVLIMRGGGSDLDLACFDDYDLAVTIAKCPLPVFTAIGHDKDYHVADMVANTFVKTPTALADLFLECFIAEDEHITSFESRLQLAFNNRLSAMASKIDLLELRIRRGSDSCLADAIHKIDRTESRIRGQVDSRLSAQHHHLDRAADTILHDSSRRIDKAESLIDRKEQRIKNAADPALNGALSHLIMLETRISATDPRNILKRGFVLALDGDGIKMHSAAQSRIGDQVRMMFADGTVKCGVIGVDIKKLF